MTFNFLKRAKTGPPPAFPKLYTARQLIEKQAIPGLTQESLLKLAKKHAIGKKAGRNIVFTESDISLLVEALPCSNSSKGQKAQIGKYGATIKASAMKKALIHQTNVKPKKF